LTLIGFILILVSAFFFPGIIVRTKSITSGRKGSGILQPIKEIGVLLRKGSVFSNTTGLIFQLAPAISLSCIFCALLVIPFANQAAPISFEGDFVFFSYLLGFGKFFAIIAALDTGSSFEEWERIVKHFSPCWWNRRFYPAGHICHVYRLYIFLGYF